MLTVNPASLPAASSTVPWCFFASAAMSSSMRLPTCSSNFLRQSSFAARSVFAVSSRFCHAVHACVPCADASTLSTYWSGSATPVTST